jgi:PAS domain S-box-containing protein
MVGIIHDITVRVMEEKLLKENQMRLQSIIEASVDIIWEIDAQGRCTYCSPHIEGLWGLKPEEMLGRTPFEMMPTVMRDQAMAEFTKKMVSPNKLSGMEIAAYDAHGNIIYLEVTGVPFFDDTGRLLGYRGVSRDITERVMAQREKIE